jgi:hypothetical protein
MLTQIWCNSKQIADAVIALVSPVKMPGHGEVQTVIPVRALGPVNYDRIAMTWTIEFMITRIHACALDAVEFRANHKLKFIPNVADLTMQWSEAGSTLTAAIAAAAWADVDVELIGTISTKTTYRVSGGPLVVTRNNVAAPDTVATEGSDSVVTEGGDAIDI